VKAALERWLLRQWYGGEPPGVGLRLLAGLYRVGSALRQQAPESLPVPVVVVGNFTAGGTGKTPLVIALAARLAAAGYRPAIVSRGYGRTSREPLRVAADTPIVDSGDEPRLMFERTGLPVFVDSDRLAAGRAAIAAGCDLIIADDGLQHRRLARDIEIEVVDGQRRYGNGLIIPAGPLREPPRACDFKVINGGETKDGEWQMQLRLGKVRALDGKGGERDLESFKGIEVQAIAGIGNPEGLLVQGNAFPDHHSFSARDFEALPGQVLMTEKDAINCRGLDLGDRAWVVPVEAELPEAFHSTLLQKLREHHART
jgi:tetraacyldisaccharide 4'-kinase